MGNALNTIILMIIALGVVFAGFFKAFKFIGKIMNKSESLGIPTFVHFLFFLFIAPFIILYSIVKTVQWFGFHVLGLPPLG